MNNKMKKVLLKGVALTATMTMVVGSVMISGTKSKAEGMKINPEDLGAGMSYFEVDDVSKTYEESEYYKDSVKTLGIANGFHIVAFKKANLAAHTNGNMMVKEADFNSNAGTKGIAEEVSYIENSTNTNPFEPMNSSSSLLVLGYDNEIGLTDGNTTFTVNGAKLNKPKSLASDTKNLRYVDMEFVKTQVVSISKQLRNLKDNIPAENISLSTVEGYDRNNRYVNIDDVSGLNVYNMSAAEMTEMDPPIYLGGFEEGKIGTLVINVDLNGYTDYQIKAPLRMKIGNNVINNAERTTWEYGKILYNFYDSSTEDGMYYGKISFYGVAIGTVLAPCADITISQNLDGNIIGDTVTVNAQTHRCDFTGILPGIVLVQKGNEEESSSGEESSSEKETSGKEEITSDIEEETTSEQEEITSDKEEETTSKQEEITSDKEEGTTSEKEEITSDKEEETTSEKEEITGDKEETTSEKEEVTSDKEKETTSEQEEITSDKEEETTSEKEEITSDKEKETTSEQEEVTSDKEKETTSEQEEITSDKEEETSKNIDNNGVNGGNSGNNSNNNGNDNNKDKNVINGSGSDKNSADNISNVNSVNDKKDTNSENVNGQKNTTAVSDSAVKTGDVKWGLLVIAMFMAGVTMIMVMHSKKGEKYV